MSYGNCLCWIGNAPNTSTYSESGSTLVERFYTLRVTFRRSPGIVQIIPCTFVIRDGESCDTIAQNLAVSWKNQKSWIPRAIHDQDHPHRVHFEGIVEKMTIVPPTGSEVDVQLGEKTLLETGLYVFNA